MRVCNSAGGWRVSRSASSPTCCCCRLKLCSCGSCGSDCLADLNASILVSPACFAKGRDGKGKVKDDGDGEDQLKEGAVIEVVEKSWKPPGC